MAGVPSSCKKLWVVLSGTTILKSMEEVGRSLEKQAPQIIQGLKYYKKRSVSDDAKELVELKKSCTDVPATFIQQMSIALNVDSAQCYDLFLTYLLDAYSGSVKSISDCFRTDKNIQLLISELWDFYFDERLYAIFCAKLILSNWRPGSDHPYQNMFEEFMKEANKDNVVTNSIFEQLELNLTTPVPDNGGISQAAHSHAFELVIERWMKNSLKERFELIQLLLLCFNQNPPNLSMTLKLAKLFETQGGVKYLYLRKDHLRNQELHPVMAFIAALESLVLVQCFGIETLLSSLEDGNEHPLLTITSEVRELESKVLDTNTTIQSSSILLLGWILVRSCWREKNLESESNTAIISRISRECLELEVFQFISEFLHSELFQTTFADTETGKIVRRLLAGLLSTFSTFFEVEELADKNAAKAIFKIATTLFQDNDIAELVFSDYGNGLSTILRTIAMTFPLEDPVALPMNLETFLEAVGALAKTNQSNKLANYLSSIDSYAERLDATSNFVVRSRSGDTYTNTIDRSLCGRSVIIPRLADAKILGFSSHDTVEVLWEDVSVNGWKVLSSIYQAKIDAAVRGDHASVTDENLRFLRLINLLVSNMITSSNRFTPDLRLLSTLALDGFKVFARFEPLPRLYTASCFELFTALIRVPKLYPASDFWELASELNLLPYMIGLTRDLDTIVSGKDTNPSIVGHVIATQECVTADYTLLISFLRFVATTIPLMNSNSQVQSSVVFIFSEIFPVHHRWNFKDTVQLHAVWYYCFEVAHAALNVSQATKDGRYLVELCHRALLTGASGETLLRAVHGGCAVVKNVIKTNGSDNLLHRDKQVVSVRKSLSVLNQLLLLKEQLAPGTARSTAVEKALFENSPSKPNMLLILAHYVYQNYDSRLAALSAQLFKRLAKHFPMSMLACLGSEAEAVREHFLFKLDAVTEDVRVKVSLLDFLSVCVKHQPGLIEMFVNSDNELSPEDVGTDSNASEDSSSSCLLTVLEILREKFEKRFYCPLELHCAALRFLNTFWMQAHLPAIEYLRKQPKLWTLICFPLLPEVEGVEQEDETPSSPLDEKLNVYILRLLAREIFLVQSLEKNKFDADLERKFDKLPARLRALSDRIWRASSEAIEESDVVFALLGAWRDFVVSLAKFEPFPLSDSLMQTIYLNLMASLANQLELSNGRPVAGLFADVPLMVFKKWSQPIVSERFDEWLDVATRIVYKANERREELNIGFLISVLALSSRSVSVIEGHQKLREKQMLTARAAMRDWITPACGLLLHSLRLLENSKKDSQANELRLASLAVTLFNSLVSFCSSDHQTWLPVVRNSIVVESLTSVLAELITRQQGFELAQAILSTFVVFASTESTARHIQETKVLEIMNTSLNSIYSSDTSLPIIENALSSPIMWIRILHNAFRLATTLLSSLKQYFVEDALQFVVCHEERIASSLQKLRNSPSLILVDESIEVMSLLCSLTEFNEFWTDRNKANYERLSDEISKTCYSVTAFLIRPNLFQYLLTHPSATAVAFYQSNKMLLREHTVLEGVQSTPTSGVKRSISLDGEELPKLSSQVETHLMKLLALTLRFLSLVNPSLLELLSGHHSRGLPRRLALLNSFSTPNIDPSTRCSFGSLLYCVSLCVGLITKSERCPPTTSGPHATDGTQTTFPMRNTIATSSQATALDGSPDSQSATLLSSAPLSPLKTLHFVLESSLELLVSQALVAHADVEVPERDKLLVGRELKSELNAVLSIMARNPKRISSSSLHVPSRSPVGPIVEQPFVRFVLGIVERCFEP